MFFILRKLGSLLTLVQRHQIAFQGYAPLTGIGA